MKKRIAAVFLSVTVTAALLAGCTAKSSTAVSVIRGVEKGEEAQTMQKTETVNLSEKNKRQIAIDYTIETYQPVQNFGFSLFWEHTSETNPVLSPVSAYIALTMAGEGAEGNTKQEFRNVLSNKECSLDDDMTVMSDSMMNLLPKKTENLTLELANSAWIDDEFTVNEDWTGKVTSLYDAQAYQTKVASEEAMNAMNDWVSENTHGLIPQMIDQPLDKETRMVLFNTLYFKGKWQKPFMMEATYDEDFHVSDTETVQVPMMHQFSEYYDFIETDEVKGIVMPYQDSNLAFVGLLPQGEGGRSVRDISGITPEGLSYLLADRKPMLVNVKLPKFEVSFDKILNDSLKNIGLVDAFDEEKADFSSLGTTDSGRPVYISLVRQKAVVKLDEEGTQAAAATEAAMMESCALEVEEPIEVSFDKPFLYFIMDMETELPLFVGIMDNPTLK